MKETNKENINIEEHINGIDVITSLVYDDEDD